VIGPQWYFPWRVARRYFISHFLLFVLILIFLSTAIRFEINKEFAVTSDVLKTIGYVDGRLQTLVVISVFLSAIGLIFLTRSYVKPLGRLIQRARQLRKNEQGSTLSPNQPEAIEAGEEAEEEEPGEWQDLEHSLVRMYRDLRKKTQLIERDREEISALVGAVSDAILSIDRDMSVRFYNSQFGYLFGIVTGANQLSDILRTPEVIESFSRVLKSGRSRNLNASLYTKLHGQSRYFSLSVSPMINDLDGSIDGAVGVFHDVTELKQTEQVRIDFVANASHELRSPLTSIKGYMDTIKKDLSLKRYDDLDQFVETASRSVNRLTDLVSDLLDLSTIESGAEIQRSQIPVEELTASVVQQLEPKARAKNQKIEVSYEIATLHADPKRVEQVLLNLLDNAIKYVPVSGKINISWKKLVNAYELRIKDNGPGIPFEHQGRLFERFYRVDPGRSREQGGTGLGLAIVKHIMIKHEGSVKVASQAGGGTEFICSFPQREPTAR
jgi:two-component system, OmpR family, phosphate regulon sensor histidine kinase PhoR